VGPGKPLTDDDRATYEWQMWTDGLGEEGQRRLKNAAVLITRIGGVGGNVCWQLAAAGVGKLVLAHAGNLRQNDLNRQTLMTHAGIGVPRVEQAGRRLREFNPKLEVDAVTENINEANVDNLVKKVDVVACCAPQFQERLLLNRAAVGQKKPLVDCAMYDLDVQLTTVLPGQSACLACLYPNEPAAWKRQFPVLGAVAGAVGCLGALEIVKVLTGVGAPLANQMLIGDLRDMRFRKLKLERNPECPVCVGA
jgi:molybdopterin/thiamine biosynthesis adenylyltransferase